MAGHKPNEKKNMMYGDIVRGLHVYGAKVLRPEALVSAFYSID